MQRCSSLRGKRARVVWPRACPLPGAACESRATSLDPRPENSDIGQARATVSVPGRKAFSSGVCVCGRSPISDG